MGKLFVGLDFFYAGAYGPDEPAAEGVPALDYSHDRDRLYLVLQPFLVGSGPDAVTLSDYLGWNGARLAEPGLLVIADRSTPLEGIEKTPVPFPPGTELQLRMSWEPGGVDFSAARTLGRWQADVVQPALSADPLRLPPGAPPDDPLVLPRHQWPDFAIHSFARPLVTRWHHLAQVQQEELLSWIFALLPDLRKPAGGEGSLVREIFENHVKEKLLADETASLEKLKSYLTTGAVPPIDTLYQDLIQKAREDEPRLHPPRFPFRPEVLQQHPEVLLPDRPPTYVVTASSYHRRLWDKLVDVVQPVQRTGDGAAEAQNKEAAARERQAALALGRLFGFGERLRWPWRDGLAGFKNHFMILREKAEKAEKAETLDGWFVTNAHSLLGQVFRIGPIDPAVPLTGVSLQALTVQGIDLLAGNAPGDRPGEIIPRAQQFESDFSLFHDAAVRGQGRPFNATLQREGELTLYGPKMALGQREATFSPSGKQLFSVPGVLLDALEPAARTEMPAERDPDKAVLLRQNAPRTALAAKDLFHPEIVFPSASPPWRALFQIRVKVARHAVTGSDVPVFEVTLAAEAHPEEEKILRSWLVEIPARAAELWISPAAGGPPESFRLATVLHREEQGGLLVPDADGTLGRLLEASPRGGNGESAADLVLETRGDEPFNLLERRAAPLAEKEPGPLFVLNRSLTTRIGLSAQQLAERFGLKLSPSPFEGGMEQRQADDPILDHAANFNKLRIRLEHGEEQIKIHHPDAVLPLDVLPPPQQPVRPWTTSRPLQPEGPHFDYWLAHQFDQEVRDGADEAESGRFLAFATAGRSWEIGGHVEHQYSHRIPVTGAAVKLGRSTELVNLGNLAFRGRLAAEPGNPEIPLPLRAAVTYDHRKLDPETISVHFRRKAFQLALERFASAGTAVSEGKSAWLRQIYEALADLRSALEPGGTAELLVERWNFDNRTRTGNNAAASGEPDEAPALRPRMRLVEYGVFDLKQLPAAERAELDSVLSLLDRKFSDFRTALATRIGPGDPGDPGEDSEWLSLDIPLTRGTPGWQWTGTAGDPVFATTDAIRVALHLRRPSEVVVPESVGTARLLPMDLEAGDAGTLKADIPRIRQDLPSLEGRAQSELQEWLSPKPDGSAPLHESFAWLRSVDVDVKRPDEPADGVFDPKRHDQLFGEVSPFLNFPTDQRQKVDRVVDLYYVPFAFVPLRPHPAFGDAQTTQEFAQYLITLLDDIVQGRSFGSRLGLDPATLPVDKALELREKARRIISDPGNGRISVARHLLELLDQVDDRKGMLSWSNEAEKKLFDRVQAQLDALNSESLETQSLKAAQLDLLTRRPALYTQARAIAVGVFNPDTWSEQLYALRLYKRIREDLSIDATRGSERFDWELFTYPHFLGVGNQRYFLDVLEEGRYDNELEILPSQYQNVPVLDTSRIGEIRSLAATPLARRGDAQARRAEDLIEQIHGFTPPDEVGAMRRSIEANVVHYNPEWRTRRKSTGEIERWSYILPSRRFPGVPKPILPAASHNATRQADPWRSPLIPTFPEAVAINLDAAFPVALQEVLGARKEVFLATAVESEENRAIPARRLEQISGGPAMASVEPERASGWHFLETWLSHFYFVVEAGDAELTISETLSNDIFEIETEVWATPPPLEAAQEIPGFEAKTNLQKWFLYHGTQQQGTPGAEVVTPPPGVPLADALQEMEDWLVGFAGPAPAESPTRGEVLLRRLHDKDVAEAEAASSPLGGTVMLFSLAEDGWSLQPDKRDDGKDHWNLPDGTAVGAVLAAEVMELLEKKAGPPRKGTFLIRVSVLESPWRYVRARLRVRRNARDVDGNRDTDINPSFAMLTAHSDWVTFGRQVLTLGPEDFARYRLPAELRRLEVFPEGEKGISLDQWLEGPTAPVSFGPLLQRAVEQASFRDLHGQEQFFWDRQAVSADHHVVGILLQEIEDAAPRKGLAEETQDIPQRRDLIARQHLPRVNADKLATLTDGIRHDLVLTDSPLLKATWFNAANEAVLDVTWPVEILP